MSLLSLKKRLIEIVEVNPVLWKLNKKNADVKRKLWNEVGAQLGISGFDARRQWEILRDQFRREHKNYYHASFKSKWMFYDQMLFLKDGLRSSRNELSYTKVSRLETSNLEVLEGETEQNETGNLDAMEYGKEESEVSSVDTVESEIEDIKPSNVENYKLPTKNVSKIHVRQDLQELKSSLQLVVHKGIDEVSYANTGVSSSAQQVQGLHLGLNLPIRKKKRKHSNDTKDEDYHFVMCLLPSLRSLGRSSKLKIRSKIINLIADELKTV